jgi:hypothetical protein
LSLILGLAAICLILAFYFFLGCPYEFIKCYLEKKYEYEDEIIEEDFEMDEEHVQSRQKEEEEPEKMTNGKIAMCVLLGILGIACQPLYLMFFLVYAMMECYRRFGCWMFYASTI